MTYETARALTLVIQFLAAMLAYWIAARKGRPHPWGYAVGAFLIPPVGVLVALVVRSRRPRRRDVAGMVDTVRPITPADVHDLWPDDEG